MRDDFRSDCLSESAFFVKYHPRMRRQRNIFVSPSTRPKVRRELGQFAESVNRSIESWTDRAPSSEPAKRARAKESGKGLRQIELIRRQYLGGSQRTGRRYGRIAGKLGVKQRFGSTGNWNYVCRTLGGSRRENKHG